MRFHKGLKVRFINRAAVGPVPRERAREFAKECGDGVAHVEGTTVIFDQDFELVPPDGSGAAR